jgi:dihydroflavonol-4-reductase
MDTSCCKIPAGTPVLITGATGFTGSWLMAKLLDAGAAVRAIARASSDISRFDALPIEWYRGNVYDADVVGQAAEGVAYVFHVAAAFREARIPDEEYYRVHVMGTQLLARAAIRNPHFKRFVHVSTMGVHGHVANPPANENSPFHPGDIYQRTKLEAEQWLGDFAQRNKLHCTIIRPTGIYGPGDKRLFKIFKMASKAVFPVLGFGKCLCHLVHVDDLTNVILLSATHPAADGEVFLCGNSEPIALTDMARLISHTIGSAPAIVRLPASPFFLAAWLCEWLCKPFGIEPPIYRRRVAYYTKDRSFDTSKMRERLGYRTKFTNESGLVSTARWYVENGWLRGRIKPQP